MIDAHEIIAIRAALGLSQAQFGIAVGVPKAGAAVTVSRWEAGTQGPTGPAAAMIELLRDSPEARRLRGIADRS